VGPRLNALRKILFLVAMVSRVFAQSSQEAGPAPVDVSATEEQSHLLKRVAPVYPALARQARIQGVVMLRVGIDKSGNTENLTLVSGHPMLAPAAIEAVKQWKYEPYVVDGKAVAVQTTVEVNFALEGGPPSTSAAPDGTSNTTPSTPTRVRVSSGVSRGLLVSKVNPVYPEDARRARIQGSVLLRVIIDREGNISSVELLNGDPALADAAIDATRQWKYRPYLLNGQPVEVETQVQINFTLNAK